MNEDMRHAQQMFELFEDCLKHPEKLRNTYFDSEDLGELFRMYLSCGDIKKAEKVANLAVSLHPDDEDAKLYELNIMLEKCQPKKALKWIDEHPMPDTGYALYLRLCTYIDLGKAKEADLIAHKLLQKAEDKTEKKAMLEEIGNCFFRGDFQEEAISYFDGALAISTSSDETLRLLRKKVDCLAESDRINEAIEMLDKLNDEDPYNLNLWQNKTMLLLKAGRIDEALDAIDYALAISPSNEVNQIIKIRILIGDKTKEEVYSYIDSVREELPHLQPILLMLKGDVAFGENDYKTANQYYKQGFDKEFFMLDSVLRYIDCKIELHRYRSALKIGKFLLQIIPDDPQLLNKIADAYFFIGEKETAKKYLKRSIKIDPENLATYLQLVSLLLDIDELNEAQQLTKRALKNQPDQMYLKLMMAIIGYLKEDYKQLIRYFSEACESSDRAIDLLEQLCPKAAEFISDLVKDYQKNEKNDEKK